MPVSGGCTMSDYISDVMIGSVHDVFLTLLAMEVFPGPNLEPESNTPDKTSANMEMTVIVGFSGALNGGLRLSCPQSVAQVLAATLLGQMVATAYTEALVQLVNRIAYSVQSRVCCQQEHGIVPIHLTPATVVSGQHYGLSYSQPSSSVKQSFQVDAGAFFVECFYLDATQEE